MIIGDLLMRLRTGPGDIGLTRLAVEKILLIVQDRVHTNN